MKRGTAKQRRAQRRANLQGLAPTDREELAKFREYLRRTAEDKSKTPVEHYADIYGHFEESTELKHADRLDKRKEAGA